MGGVGQTPSDACGDKTSPRLRPTTAETWCLSTTGSIATSASIPSARSTLATFASCGGGTSWPSIRSAASRSGSGRTAPWLRSVRRRAIPVVLRPGSDEASVYRAVDGQLLGTRKVPSKLPATPQLRRLRAGGKHLDLEPTRGWSSWAAISSPGGRARMITAIAPGPCSTPGSRKRFGLPGSSAAGARISMVGSKAVGVLEPSGRFVLVALADGHAIADLKLEARPHFSVTDIVVSRGWATNTLSWPTTATIRCTGNVKQWHAADPGHDQLSRFLAARIYALDLKGKLSWPAPVNVDHQYFLLSQPGRLPVLVFAAFQYANAGRAVRADVVAKLAGGDRPPHGPHRVRQQGPPRPHARNGSGNPRRPVGEDRADLDQQRDGELDLYRQTGQERRAGEHGRARRPSGKLGEALLDAIQGGVEAIASRSDKKGAFRKLCSRKLVGAPRRPCRGKGGTSRAPAEENRCLPPAWPRSCWRCRPRRGAKRK